METLTVKALVTTEKEIDIPVPFFRRTIDERNYIGLLDKQTVVRIYTSDNYSSLSNSNLDYQERTKLIEAWENKEWTHCGETEFFDKYHDVVESMSLHPILAI